MLIKKCYPFHGLWGRNTGWFDKGLLIVKSHVSDWKQSMGRLLWNFWAWMSRMRVMKWGESMYLTDFQPPHSWKGKRSLFIHLMIFIIMGYILLLEVWPEKAMAPHSSTLAWKIPWTEEPGGLQSMGSQRVGHDWATSLSFFTFMHWRRKWQPTPVFLSGESQGRGSLVGCRLWGHTKSDTIEVT